MKCLNCDAEATTKVLNESSDDQFFCDRDIPSFLLERGFESRIVRIDTEKVVEEEIPAAPKPPKKKKEEAVAEPVVEPVSEPVVEESVVEEVVAEEKAAE